MHSSVAIDSCDEQLYGGWSGEHPSLLHPGQDHGPYEDLAPPLLIPILFDMGLRRVRRRIDRLLAMTLREGGMVRGFFVMCGCLS